MKLQYSLKIVLTVFLMMNCDSSTAQLKRVSYNSQIEGEERDFYLYLPNGYTNSDHNWPVLMFLHGNGERGDGKEELDFVMKHGPLMEAWVYKRDLPFIIIAPQLHMFGLDTTGIDYLSNRNPEDIPRRLEKGIPDRQPVSRDSILMQGVPSQVPDTLTLPHGWNKVNKDLIHILDHVHSHFQTDTNRVYLTGISYGGFGTWHLASSYPKAFSAIAPVVGWGHPDLMDPIAHHQIPVWAFAGGRDQVIEKKFFYPGLNRLEQLGHPSVRFTVHEDMGHDTWKRVYAGQDLYSWLLEQNKDQ